MLLKIRGIAYLDSDIERKSPILACTVVLSNFLPIGTPVDLVVPEDEIDNFNDRSDEQLVAYFMGDSPTIRYLDNEDDYYDFGINAVISGVIDQLGLLGLIDAEEDQYDVISQHLTGPAIDAIREVQSLRFSPIDEGEEEVTKPSRREIRRRMFAHKSHAKRGRPGQTDEELQRLVDESM